MSENINNCGNDAREAFNKGMMIALGVAFLPLALIATVLYLSGSEPKDFSPDLRLGLLAVWLVFVFSVDRIANLRVWLRIPLLRAANTGEVITIVAFSALLATMRLNPAAIKGSTITEWFSGFGAILLIFAVLYAAYKGLNRARRIASKRRAFFAQSGIEPPQGTGLTAGAVQRLKGMIGKRG